MADVNTIDNDPVKPTVRRFIRACIAALVIMLVCGLSYRSLYLHLNKYLSKPVKLPIPLSAFPIQVGDWLGRDVPISETVQQVAGNDDFISRLYQNSEKRLGVSLYVAYSARPRYMQGHKPTACYPSSGWNYDGTEKQSMTTKNGQSIPYMMHHFSRVTPYEQSIYVLNFYLVNGQVTLDEKRFSDIASRNPNIEGNPARYVAQVQIMSQVEEGVLVAGYDMIDDILRYFPDASGVVPAAQQADNAPIVAP